MLEARSLFLLLTSTSASLGRSGSVWWNDEIKSAVRRKEVLAASNEEAKEGCMEAYKEEKGKVKRCIYHSIKIKYK